MSTPSNPPLVWGYRWEPEVVEDAKRSRKLLRAAIAIPGGEEPSECNLKCIFCFTEGGKRHRGRKGLTNEEVISFAKEASTFAFEKEQMSYFFVSEGEPSLNRGLIDVLEETAKLGGTMTIFTNLLLLPDHLADAYACMKNLFVCGKMYGIQPQTTDYLTGVKNSHEVMMKNINKLIDRGLASEGRLGVQCVVTSRNQDEIIDIFKWGRAHHVVPHIMMYREQGLGANHTELTIPIQKLMDIFKACAEYDLQHFGYQWTPMPPMLGLGTCYIPGVNLYLVSNGLVHICAGITQIVGDYREKTLAHMMDSVVLSEFRENFQECPWVTELRNTGDLILDVEPKQGRIR